ncbi:Zinc finger and SCAN domain-containing protein 12 [Trachymyrmex zeteki]|uniref:Zinc finger and SCAN domain-containing protein 12 n=1 Tax=Mycetomoellerius zeteki TaxID=64791 RepID=A0A151WHH9_9HYME|nr:Zinc finger and SCAN domain-containing protein 12 [Trachymyrmex zeteki]
MWNGAEKEACGDAVESNNKKDAENCPASDQQQFASNDTVDTADVPVSEGIQIRSVFPQIASFASCPGMADDTMIIPGDADDTTILIPPPNVAEFQIECKTEPGTELGNSIDDDDPLDESSLLHIPVFAPTIKDPIILLERCDKIWETLQLIKTIQVEKPTTLTDDDCDKNKEEKNEEKVQHLDEIEQSESHVKNQPRLRSNNTMPPFKVSVLRTKKLYPCITCGIQYLERRSLRKHSERVHGVVLPLLIQRKRLKCNALNKKNFNGASQVSSISKENNNSEKLYDNKDSCEKTTAKTKLTNVETTASPPAVSTRLVKCTLCQQKVLCLRKHLINYHKIGGSTSVMEQLESSLLSEPKISPGDKRTTLKNEPHQDGFRIMDNENDTRKTSKVQGKRKYKLTYPRKKRKLNNERYAIVQNPSTVTQEEILSAYTYKCDICLGLYKTAHSLYKHKRNHILRGETKENFHKFTCRYFNSPFNKKYKSLQSSMKSTNTIANSANNRINEKHTSQLNNSKRNTLRNQNNSISNRAIRYSERINKNNETICICGRSFRNPHTLFLHKNNCELCQNEDTAMSTRVSSDRDSGIGINITIKKLNDSYEIVGKDDEDKLQNSKILKEDTSSMSHTSNYTKDFTKASTKRQVLDTSDSKYSKDHSILKLEDTDEDVIIDIEDDVQIALDENNTTKQMVTQENEDKNEKYNQIKETCKKNNRFKNQETHQNKRELRSANKRYLYSKMESDYSHDERKVCTMQFKSMICGYCKEQFNNIKLYDTHQCTIIKGRSFDEFSLQLRCFFCKEMLNSYSEFDEHMKFKHFDRGYHCFQCPVRFTNDKARLSHFHSDHNDLICRFCNKKITISSKAPHEGYHLGFGYPCHKCKKAYTNSRNLSYHKYTIHFNGADNLVTCTICLKSVKLKTFRGHMKCHKHNACYFCGKVFSDRVGLEYHTMMNHGTNSKLKCNICGTRFYTKKLLERHEKIDGCNNYMRMKS